MMLSTIYLALAGGIILMFSYDLIKRPERIIGFILVGMLRNNRLFWRVIGWIMLVGNISFIFKAL